ncbi:hypothetical protein [Flagellimonas zhangzhouensis]|uniref:UDP-N-acetylmuramate: L-alanyl-gamma-D-glutamyl-meso-diaminopimelate ligase n=1 Tax=Flagellimonas zhangzhouensis TaxID=1073328 RepID=A0A1H2Q4J3_9FLAO|nr:hypothetical protein [Allomuricauda zhangzhouensis]SDQ48234.1 UDP-N-acetylmuramate: L-alanyl-gamma-D-glutamyl-meso-diaminopimelate ligase [Allomuricauda zhangzhouensis]SDW02025.1 UDP-N-acetylmuramate: L-alanyl-gamma-D-glutamyl-meso-diaminopimelate ligase [Allomuricauda zhangzhouensis]
MQIHFTGVEEKRMANLAVAMQAFGHQVSVSASEMENQVESLLDAKDLLPSELGYFSEKIHDGINAVVFGSEMTSDNAELQRAEELGVKTLSYAEFLFEQVQYKTRVVIAGSGRNTVAEMILHVLDFNDKSVDFVLDESMQLSEENDFIVLIGSDDSIAVNDSRPEFEIYHPNIALLSDMKADDATEKFQAFVDGIVKGGSITFNEEDAQVKNIVEATENPIRKFPYATPEFIVEDGIVYLDTPDGEMPLEISGNGNLGYLAGAKWICQQMGVDEEDFYDAISTFKIK